MGASSVPEVDQFSIGWLKVRCAHEIFATGLEGETACIVLQNATLSVMRRTDDGIELLLMLRIAKANRLWTIIIDECDAYGALLWIHDCMMDSRPVADTNSFMDFIRKERSYHEKGERRMVTSMSMLDFLQRMADLKLTKNRFGEIMHGDYSEDEKKRALEQMEMAGGYDNLADD